MHHCNCSRDIILLSLNVNEQNLLYEGLRTRVGKIRNEKLPKSHQSVVKFIIIMT